MDKRKLSKIPRPCATQRMINDAKQLESMNHMVTAELIEDKKILLLNFFRIKSLAGGNTEAEFRTFLSHEDYITQDLKTSKTKWYTASFAGMWNFSFTEYLWDPELKRSRYKVNVHIRWRQTFIFWNGCSICFGICKTKKCDKCSLQGGPETGRPYIRWGTANDFYSRGRCISADYKKSFKVSTEF